MIPALIAILIYSAWDFIGYNLVGRRQEKLYRVLQTIVKIDALYSLGAWQGTPHEIIWPWLRWSIPMIQFQIMSMTFLADFMYYGLAEITNWWGLRGSFAEEVLGDRVTWANWTLWGLVRYGNAKVPISGKVLIIQAALGLIAAGLLSFIK